MPEDRPAFGELLRPRLIDRLRCRFEAPVIEVLAGPGCGKSTLLGQALRNNQATPLGIDIRLGRPWDPSELAGAIVRALGGRTGEAPPAEQLLDAVRSASPLDVCVIVDDAH